MTETVLTHCITEIRQALQDDIYHPRYIKTIPRVGYKFIAEVEEITSAAEEVKALTVEKPSLAIAVLPFVNLSAEPENEYFCDGLAEELINGLTKVKDLRVVAHSSAFSFKGRDLDVRDIGRKLNVGSVLEGSVRKAGHRLRISAQLVSAADGYHLWAEQYDREMQDVFAIQDEISLAIVDKLKVRMLGEEKTALMKRHTENLDAYHLYLKGRYFWHRWPEGFLQKALECFQQAIEKDPLYALPYAGLADAYSILGFWQFMAPGDAFPVARAMAEKALAIDDTLAEAHTSLALTQLAYEWDWAAAERGFKRAIELNPGYPLAHIFYSHYLSAMGRQDEAIAETYQAQELDPLSLLVNAKVGMMLYLAREYEAAMEQLHKTLELDPHFGITYLFIGACYVGMRRYEEANLVIQQAIEVTRGLPQAAELIGYVYALMGNRDKARKILDETEALMKQSYVPATAPALIYLGLGEDDKVFEWLNRAYEEHGPSLLFVAISPEYDRLRPDPRFQDLLRRMRL